MTGYLGLGSNVGDRRANLQAAVDALGAHGVAVTASSSTYDTDPVGEVLDQPAFLNACLRIETDLEPEALLDACKAVERELGRAPEGGVRHGPRPIDVDVLLLGDRELPLRAADAAARAGDERGASCSSRCSSSTSSCARPTATRLRDALARLRPRRGRAPPRLAAAAALDGRDRHALAPLARVRAAGDVAVPVGAQPQRQASAGRPARIGRMSPIVCISRIVARSGGRRRSAPRRRCTPSAIQPSTRSRWSGQRARGRRGRRRRRPRSGGARCARRRAPAAQHRARDRRQLRARRSRPSRCGAPRRRPQQPPGQRLEHLVAPALGPLDVRAPSPSAGYSGGSGTSPSRRRRIAREPTSFVAVERDRRNRPRAERSRWSAACIGGGSSTTSYGMPLSSSARSTAAHGCEPWTT